ncbi:hypothetical protein NMY22_g19529 [Coprinellus aureogranulatus]|nr:hypothetical protein NMY22_g19529 [Coprinellus aureogranulatus]
MKRSSAPYRRGFASATEILLHLHSGLRSAVDIAKQALDELPRTPTISCLLPDKFSEGCTGLWGQKSSIFAGVGGSNSVACGGKWDASDASDPNSESHPGCRDTAGWGKTGGWGDEINGNSQTVERLANPEGWAATGWGKNDGWEEKLSSISPHEEGFASSCTKRVEDGDGESVGTADEPPPFLMGILEPTLLSLTHTTGVVEKSLRKIARLIPARRPNAGQSAMAAIGPQDDSNSCDKDPGAVESVLGDALPQVIMVPWLHWDGGEFPGYREPMILQDTQRTQTSSISAAPELRHNPYDDPITVLVEPSVFEQLIPGMGLAGTWVEIIRQQSQSEGSQSMLGPPSKKRKVVREGSTNMWYLEEVGGVFPSYWAPKQT